MRRAALGADLAGFEPQPGCGFSSGHFETPDLALQRFRELTRSICDVTVHGELADFHVASNTRHLHGALLIESVSSALRYDRTEAHVAQGVDHVHVTLYLAGGAEFMADGRVFLQRAGDVSIIDMARPSVTLERQAEDGTTRVMSVLIPGLMLAPLASPELRPTIHIWRRETVYGRMLGDILLALRDGAEDFPQRESQAAIHALVHLIAGGLGAVDDIEAPRPKMTQEVLRKRLLAHIETHLLARTLGIDTLCRDFGLSRAALYRLFAPHPPASYIQERRLQRAFAMMLSPAFRAWRIIDIALECQFSSDASFIRAFRRRFEMTPGEARKRLERGEFDARPAGPPLPEPDAEALRWITELTGTLLSPGR